MIFADRKWRSRCAYTLLVAPAFAATISDLALKHLRGSALSRRSWIEKTTTTGMTVATATVLPQHGCQAIIDSENDDVFALRRTCADGALMLESPIPGAYENSCMYLPVREVPIVVRNRTNSKDDDEDRESVIVLKIKQQGAEAGKTGMAVWNSSLLLTRLLQGLSADFWKHHSSVVELGCGPGLASIAAAALGASRVMATDGNPNVVQLAQSNVQANPIQHAQVQAQLLSWGLLDAFDHSETASLVIGSDLTYNPAGWPILADTMATVLQPNGLVLYLSTGHPGFNVQGETDGFLSVAKSRGLVQVLPNDQEDYPFDSSPEELLLQSYRSDEEKMLLGFGLRVSILRKAIRPKKSPQAL